MVIIIINNGTNYKVKRLEERYEHLTKNISNYYNAKYMCLMHNEQIINNQQLVNDSLLRLQQYLYHVSQILRVTSY